MKVLDKNHFRVISSQIDVALRFYGNSSLGYNSILTPTDSITSISMVFNPSESTGLMLNSSAGGENQESMSLQLNDGTISFITEVGGEDFIATATGVIQQDTWYQLFATRYGTSCEGEVSFSKETPSFSEKVQLVGCLFHLCKEALHTQSPLPPPPPPAHPPLMVHCTWEGLPVLRGTQAAWIGSSLTILLFLSSCLIWWRVTPCNYVDQGRFSRGTREILY